jgi:hypothetical protein
MMAKGLSVTGLLSEAGLMHRRSPFFALPLSRGALSGDYPDARWREAILLTVLLWLFVLVIYLPVLIDRHKGEGWSSIALDGSTIMVSMMLAMPIFALFRVTRGWPPRRRAAALAAAVIGASLVQTAFDFLFTGWVAQNLEGSWQALPRNLSRSYGAAFNYICVYGVNLALFHLLSARRRELNQERQLAEARSATQQAQLAALRFQLNPHFLFNTLNAISAMIVTRRNEEAEQMTDKLSSFLRASLSSDPTALVPLDSELAMIEEYFEIESIRFGERLAVEVDCSKEACGALVPGFLLQPLVENAVKYGVAPSKEPVLIRIRAVTEGADLVIRVEDDGVFASAQAKAGSTGVGLHNVRRRLETLYGAAASLEAGPREKGYAATIRLPLTPPGSLPSRNRPLDRT